MAITIPKLIRNSPVLRRLVPGFVWIGEEMLIPGGPDIMSPVNPTIWADGIMMVKDDENLYNHLLHQAHGYNENTSYLVFPRGERLFAEEADTNLLLEEMLEAVEVSDKLISKEPVKEGSYTFMINEYGKNFYLLKPENEQSIAETKREYFLVEKEHFEYFSRLEIKDYNYKLGTASSQSLEITVSEQPMLLPIPEKELLVGILKNEIKAVLDIKRFEIELK